MQTDQQSNGPLIKSTQFLLPVTTFAKEDRYPITEMHNIFQDFCESSSF